MKIGYSNAIGEHVEASDLDYGDISDFQIVCPVCREPVHKVERSAQHFLSHKHRTPGENQECELRVASFTREQLDALDSISRGQTLEAFFADLPDMIDEVMPRDRGPAMDWRELARTLTWKPTARNMRDASREFLRRTTDADMDEKIASSLDGKRRTTDIQRTSRLNRHLQSRAAKDMFRTLMTPNGKIGFNHLYWAAWSATWTKFAVMDEDGSPTYNGGVMHVDNINELVVAHLSQASNPTRNFDKLVARSKDRIVWTERDAVREYGLSVNGVVDNQICYEIFAILANLDYVGRARRGGLDRSHDTIAQAA